MAAGDPAAAHPAHPFHCTGGEPAPQAEPALHRGVPAPAAHAGPHTAGRQGRAELGRARLGSSLLPHWLMLVLLSRVPQPWQEPASSRASVCHSSACTSSAAMARDRWVPVSPALVELFSQGVCYLRPWWLSCLLSTVRSHTHTLSMAWPSGVLILPALPLHRPRLLPESLWWMCRHGQGSTACPCP